MNEVLEAQKERIFSDFSLCVFLTHYFLLSCRQRSPKSSAFHPLEHDDLHFHLLFGVFRCLSGAHPHGALLPDSA